MWCRNLFKNLLKCCLHLQGDISRARRLLDEGRVVHETTEEGESLLSLACSAGYYELAQVSPGPAVPVTTSLFRLVLRCPDTKSQLRLVQRHPALRCQVATREFHFKEVPVPIVLPLCIIAQCRVANRVLSLRFSGSEF